ncbi:hypothetical protein D7D52_33515 [Nocardia yunnanensis]|uniref:Toxin-antitoxin system, toxin component n=2 Tax=Nocardia yunnanensis TaxID=2382165 RepID=A0A386ZMX2_9NOCA|nr:hypothetical protein D7D52_33515 [Nocardia yunnanensis]
MPDPRQAAQFAHANGVYCRYCGATPAVDLDFRAHRGMVFIMQFRKLPGPYCRDCGLASFRKMTGDSLVQGWWGPMSAIIANPVTLLINTVNRARLQQLPPPIPGAPSLPMDPGRPLWQRPSIIGAFLPLGVLALILAGAANDSHSSSNRGNYSYTPTSTYALPNVPVHPSVPAAPTTQPAHDAKSAKVGDCVWDQNGDIAKDNRPSVQVVPCGDPRAQATVVARPTGANAGDQCDDNSSDVVITHSTSVGGLPEVVDFALCLLTR